MVHLNHHKPGDHHFCRLTPPIQVHQTNLTYPTLDLDLHALTRSKTKTNKFRSLKKTTPKLFFGGWITSPEITWQQFHRIPPGFPKKNRRPRHICETGTCNGWWIAFWTGTCNSWSSWWLNQPIWKISNVKLEHFPRVRGENRKYLNCHHLVMLRLWQGLIIKAIPMPWILLFFLHPWKVQEMSKCPEGFWRKNRMPEAAC